MEIPRDEQILVWSEDKFGTMFAESSSVSRPVMYEKIETPRTAGIDDTELKLSYIYYQYQETINGEIRAGSSYAAKYRTVAMSFTLFSPKCGERY